MDDEYATLAEKYGCTLIKYEDLQEGDQIANFTSTNTVFYNQVIKLERLGKRVHVTGHRDSYSAHINARIAIKPRS